MLPQSDNLPDWRLCSYFLMGSEVHYAGITLEFHMATLNFDEKYLLSYAQGVWTRLLPR